MSELDATVATLATAPAETAILTDFDGSLAPIVDDPDAAVPLPAAVTTLTRLVPLVGRVGVVSGRTLDFLTERLPVPGLFLAGVYGLEVSCHGERRLDSRAEPYREVIEAAAGDAEARLPGVLVERKAGLGVTLHWRACPEREAEIRSVGHIVAALHGLDAPLQARRALELRPPLPVDKGTAVEAVLDGYAVAAFAGDDAGDVPAFDALDRLREAGRLRQGVRIGVRSPEAPPELLARADLVVDGPGGLAALLGAVADALSRPA